MTPTVTVGEEVSGRDAIQPNSKVTDQAWKKQTFWIRVVMHSNSKCIITT